MATPRQCFASPCSLKGFCMPSGRKQLYEGYGVYGILKTPYPSAMVVQPPDENDRKQSSLEGAFFMTPGQAASSVLHALAAPPPVQRGPGLTGLQTSPSSPRGPRWLRVPHRPLQARRWRRWRSQQALAAEGLPAEIPKSEGR